MDAGPALALIACICCCAALVARLAVEPLRGRPHWQCRAFLLLVAAVAALPESLVPLLVRPGPAIADVAVTTNLLVLTALLAAEKRSAGRLLSAAGLDHLLAVVCAAVMTLGTGGAILIESTDPLGASFGHVLSLGLLIACVVHLRWASLLAPAPRPHNARAPLGPAIPAALAGAGLLVTAALFAFVSAVRCADPAVTLTVAALAATPELAILSHAVRLHRPDVACAVVLGSITWNLSATAVVDLLVASPAAYRLEDAGITLAVATASAAILLVLGLRLMREA